MSDILYKLHFYKALGYKFVDIDSFFARSWNEVLSLESLNQDIRSCNLCQLCKTRTKSVVGSGSKQPNLMIVSSYPDSKDDKAGYANLDEDFRQKLEQIGIKNENIYFTYLLKCKPSSNLTYMSLGFRQCQYYFEEELRLVNPKVILALGEDVFLNITNEKNCAFDSVRGGIFKFKNTLLLPTYSLEFVAKNPSLLPNFNNDLEKLKGYA
ncbi:uracil-DNA glycosylase family protein [Campylobacter iguaniorum]|uniref:uracil-DNA glycosylase n=1 Tax=Campylobacter iguaniorum TaxID=1244531 RepID=UPI0007C8D819|nr:uracil-DNA glycosylase [Campylobacter iguaniorum]ANE35600.1 uracil-DNA glycosylase family protein [Campylobacter iguaniorum]